MLYILRLWKKKFKNDIQIYLEYEKPMIGYREGKDPQWPRWDQWRFYIGGDMTLIYLFWGAGRSQNGPSWFLWPQVPCSLSRKLPWKPWKVSFLSPFFPWRGPSARTCDAYLGSADLGVRSSGKSNLFDTIISASSALCSPGEWRVTLMLLT